MADRIDKLEERIQVVEGKVDRLASAMSAGFQAVDEALREQREYTEFCFVRLEQRMEAGFARMDERFTRMDGRFAKMDERFTKMDERFAKMDGRFTKMDERFAQIDDRLAQMDGRLTGMDGRLARVEGKLDQFIDVQTRANELVERRLRALE